MGRWLISRPTLLVIFTSLLSYWTHNSSKHLFTLMSHAHTHTRAQTHEAEDNHNFYVPQCIKHDMHFVPFKMWIYVSCKRVGSQFQPVGLAFSNSTLYYSPLVISSCPFITLMKWRRCQSRGPGRRTVLYPHRKTRFSNFLQPNKSFLQCSPS